MAYSLSLESSTSAIGMGFAEPLSWGSLDSVSLDSTLRIISDFAPYECVGLFIIEMFIMKAIVGDVMFAFGFVLPLSKLRLTSRIKYLFANSRHLQRKCLLPGQQKPPLFRHRYPKFLRNKLNFH